MKPKYPNGLAAAMRRAGVGPTKLAGLVDTSKQNIDRWSRGERKLTVDWAIRLAPELKATPEELLLSNAGAIAYVPLLDDVQAGRLTAPTSQIPAEDVPKIPVANLGRGEFFALRVQGNSMNRLSPEGSVLLVNRADRTLVNGKAYVFAMRGETTYKLWHGGDPPYLAPFSTDPSHEPHFVKRRKDFEVIGRVRRSILDL